MKKTMYLSGAISSTLLLTGILFRFMYWEFGPITAGLLICIGILTMAFLFIPTFSIYHYSKGSE